jgi:hypothetical protein
VEEQQQLLLVLLPLQPPPWALPCHLPWRVLLWAPYTQAAAQLRLLLLLLKLWVQQLVLLLLLLLLWVRGEPWGLRASWAWGPVGGSDEE